MPMNHCNSNSNKHTYKSVNVCAKTVKTLVHYSQGSPEKTKTFDQIDTLYLEVIVESVLAAILVTLTTGEVVAEVAGGISAIGSEHGADFVGGVATGVSHDARPCR